MEKQIQAIKDAITKGDPIYLLEGSTGDASRKVKPLYVKGATLDDETIKKLVKCSKLFVSEDDAQKHSQDELNRSTRSLEEMPKDRLLDMLFHAWIGEEKSQIQTDAMIKKIEAEFGVKLELPY